MKLIISDHLYVIVTASLRKSYFIPESGSLIQNDPSSSLHLESAEMLFELSEMKSFDGDISQKCSDF